MDFDIEIVTEKSPLTKRENEVFLLLVEGHATKVMSATLNRSVDTLNRHLTHIFTKLHVENAKQAITAGFVRGIVRSKNVLLVCLVVLSTGSAILPSAVYASDFIPINRVRVRGGRTLRTGNQLRLRTPSKRKRDGDGW